MRCEDTFTFKAPDWSELAQYTKLREPRQDCGGRKYGDIYKQFHEQVRARIVEPRGALTRAPV